MCFHADYLELDQIDLNKYLLLFIFPGGFYTTGHGEDAMVIIDDPPKLVEPQTADDFDSVSMTNSYK